MRPTKKAAKYHDSRTGHSLKTQPSTLSIHPSYKGSAELREVAAEGLGQLVEITGEEALRPYVVQSTGPLIRIIGDRFPWQVKAAILRTLGILIAKAGAGLKPFVPQLQTTFVKCLLDPEPRVRRRGHVGF